MDNVEQLKQDNAKLQERLNNAAKFFREQKSQIETLTKEKEELNKQCNEYELKLQKLESDIDSKDKAYKILQDTYNEVFAEKEKITNQYKEQEKFESEIINTKVPELETKLKNSEAAYEELRKKYYELKELHDGDLKRYNELENNYEGLQNKFKDNDIARGEAELKASNLQSEYERIFGEQDKEIKDLNTQVETLKKKFEEEGSNNVANKVLLDEAHQVIESKDKAYKVLQDTYNEVFGELNELKETNKRNVNAFEDLNNKFKQLNELYDACEAEKLGAQADYENLKEQFEHIKIQEEANREAAAQAEELYEECEKYRNFMRALSQLTKTVNIEWLSPNEMNEDQKKVLNEVTTPKKEQATNKDTKNVATDKGKNFREQDFPLMSM